MKDAAVRHRQWWLNFLAFPFIYALVVPLLLLDLAVSAYQLACFPLFGIARVRRGEYFAMDRGRLPYLNALQKLHCAYCGYANGLLAYTVEIAARTEQYWCPIQHARAPAGAHARYPRFLPYGDGNEFPSRASSLRRSLVQEVRPGSGHQHGGPVEGAGTQV